MRLKIIALICLLTIAVPVEADAPSDQDDWGSSEAILENLERILHNLSACITEIAPPIGHNNIGAATAFLDALSNDSQDTATLILSPNEYGRSPIAYKITVDKDFYDFTIKC
jgi:hypothetical protein